MSEETKVAGAEAVNEVKAEAKVEVKEKPIHEVGGEGEKNTIPEAAFLSEKKARKEAEREIKELKKMISEGATKKEVSDEVSSIADEFNVDPKFLKKIADSIRKDVEGELENKLKPIEEMNKAEKFDKAFTKDVNEVLADMPDFKDIVNKDVIKSLTLKYLSDSSKKNMTLREIIEETYGGALRGKRTIETTTPRGGKEPEDIDAVRMKKDPTYLAEVLANPTLKAKYNKEMLKRVENYL